MNVNNFQNYNLFQCFSNQNNHHRCQTDLETVSKSNSSAEDIFDIYLRVRCITSSKPELSKSDTTPIGESDETKSRS